MKIPEWVEAWGNESKETFDFIKNLAVIVLILYGAGGIRDRLSERYDMVSQVASGTVWYGFVVISILLMFANCVRYWSEVTKIKQRYEKRFSKWYAYLVMPIIVGTLSVAFFIVIANEKFKLV